jgi:hypothetical protein
MVCKDTIGINKSDRVLFSYLTLPTQYESSEYSRLLTMHFQSISSLSLDFSLSGLKKILLYKVKISDDF